MAATVVVFPLIYKSARASLEQVDRHLEDAARTLGASEWRIFIGVSLPLAWKEHLCRHHAGLARGMGEFGATLMIAGNIPGKTQTLALAIYDAFQAGSDAQAAWLVVITSAVCISLLWRRNAVETQKAVTMISLRLVKKFKTARTPFSLNVDYSIEDGDKSAVLFGPDRAKP